MMAFYARAITAGLLAVAVGWSAVALAQDDTAATPSREQFRAACGADIETYCSAATTRNERVACVTMHRDEFSQSCRSFFDAHLPKVAREE
jgi:hypothetical protein